MTASRKMIPTILLRSAANPGKTDPKKSSSLLEKYPFSFCDDHWPKNDPNFFAQECSWFRQIRAQKVSFFAGKIPVYVLRCRLAEKWSQLFRLGVQLIPVNSSLKNVVLCWKNTSFCFAMAVSRKLITTISPRNAADSIKSEPKKSRSLLEKYPFLFCDDG